MDPRTWMLYVDVNGRYCTGHSPPAQGALIATTVIEKSAYDDLKAVNVALYKTHEAFAEVNGILKAENEQLKLNYQSMLELAGDNDDQIGVVMKECAELKAALAYYADPSNWREQDPNNRPAGMTYKQRISSKDSGHIGPAKYDFGGGSFHL